MDKDNRTLGIGTTVYLQGDPPPLIMQLTLFSNKVCPDGLTDEEKAHWVIEEARKLGEEDFQRWKSLIFDKEKLDHPSEIFRQWALNEWNEVKAYETNQKSEWNRLNVENDALLSHLILEFKHDRLKDGNSIIDWSKPSTPFGWSKRFAPYFKANLCMQLLKSVIEPSQKSSSLLTIEELFNPVEKLEKVLLALKKVGIIDSNGQWSYGDRKAAICAFITILKRKEWYIFKETLAIQAQLFAEKFGTTIGQSTISDYENNPPKYTSGLTQSLINALDES